jgi:hypothetical protein
MLEAGQHVYEEARERNLRRWVRGIQNGTPISVVA